ncbi:hypothetical protein BKG60_18035 [Mycobacterium syngnathidarum]|uniref:Uncharacterized protein n=1 Tax=Mycobacterium syngnathidarum TaxID=1908205 RepID=A0A1Q9W949_9MYCO|nr:hypothetical protein [Mycobacterium sp. CnD-18-1]OHT80925.1 hypothetical protein BKG61_29915 [Mycobacterium syngnathidarum]OLT95179.1 hypothetical protein BKG60_18035 [Mycobacterium syngnathidarum]
MNSDNPKGVGSEHPCRTCNQPTTADLCAFCADYSPPAGAIEVAAPENWDGLIFRWFAAAVRTVQPVTDNSLGFGVTSPLVEARIEGIQTPDRRVKRYLSLAVNGIDAGHYSPGALSELVAVLQGAEAEMRADAVQADVPVFSHAGAPMT